MADNTFWIAALTGSTAVVASWVTSRGNTRAARIQADTAALAQRAERLRDSRRTAYLELIEQTHRMGELYWEVAAVQEKESGTERRAALLDELAERERDEYGTLRRCVRVVELEGPAAAATAANALQRSTGPFHRALSAMRSGEPEAFQRFDAAFRPFWQALTDFVDAAKTALQEP
ncbi:hypothetical protein AB0B12_06495 [Streptomyces sp. NPDC044780]|uniref:Secreted protein n=1 Tax=Streptomyces luomodiensis TaxID=3026192 RepID=A0ABY9VBN0_9ACTN|nr:MULTISPECIES: hypothetical protein [unclassified Streptomyces]WAP58790.1 hypothetical protein N6H00_29625 [Streptomyces sp. S465]WNE99369.1 hypothetical protein PS467_30565 [Streptomyces sp. SCA4-21]